MKTLTLEQKKVTLIYPLITFVYHLCEYVTFLYPINIALFAKHVHKVVKQNWANPE